jgi:phage tail-like protein
MRHLIAAFAICFCFSAAALAQQPKTTAHPAVVPPPAVQPKPPVQTSATRLAVPVDPYKNYKFRVSLGGEYVGGFSELVASEAAATSVPREPATDRESVPGRMKWSNITLKRGITHDRVFYSWASSIESGMVRDATVDVFNEAGQKASTYKLRRCEVVNYQDAPSLTAGASAASLSTVELRCGEIERQ